jgi:UDP-N-acetylglucosamine 2-epimerase
LYTSPRVIHGYTNRGEVIGASIGPGASSQWLAALGISRVTVREQTERPVTVTEGTNRLGQWLPTTDGVLTAVHVAIAEAAGHATPRSPEAWDGHTAERIVDYLAYSAVPRAASLARPAMLG